MVDPQVEKSPDVAGQSAWYRTRIPLRHCGQPMGVSHDGLTDFHRSGWPESIAYATACNQRTPRAGHLAATAAPVMQAQGVGVS